MEKQLKDYLHLYLGCEVYVLPLDTVNGWLKEQLKRIPDLTYKYILTVDNYKTTLAAKYLPILRHLSDMREEEEGINNSLMEEVVIEMPYVKLKVDCGANIHWMLSNHFDIFGLIEAGLAIDKTTLK